MKEELEDANAGASLDDEDANGVKEELEDAKKGAEEELDAIA